MSESIVAVSAADGSEEDGDDTVGRRQWRGHMHQETKKGHEDNAAAYAQKPTQYAGCQSPQERERRLKHSTTRHPLYRAKGARTV
jgi:hypothetical protein